MNLLRGVIQSNWMGQSVCSRAGYSWYNLVNYNVQLWKVLNLMSIMRSLVVLKGPERFQIIVCSDFPNLSCSSWGVDCIQVSHCVRCVLRVGQTYVLFLREFT